MNTDATIPKTIAEPAVVWIVVLHYGGPEYTRRCLDSLRKLTFRPAGIVLTDNCSPDSSGEAIANDFPEVEFQALPENLGFAGGSNAGIRFCIDRGAQWVWLLNNDTEPDTDSLAKLMQVAAARPQAGALGAVVYSPNKEGFSQSGSGTIDFVRAKTFEKGSVDQTAAFQSCQWLSGCNLLLRREAFSQANGFDEKFFLYFEDADLCHRLILNRWECLLVPSAHLKHIGCVSTGENLAVWRAYYHTRNRLLFFMRHSKGTDSLFAWLAVGTHLLRHAIVLPFRGKKGQRQLKAEMLGLRDFMRGTFGKADCLDF
ncbi:MAG: glycosyltransferase family 2 protein [Candidatus Obscuribacterales bacterium]|nr:glycosyltransferase family 2 protein [Candidatus Obscuribacterales bacterium]